MAAAIAECRGGALLLLSFRHRWRLLLRQLLLLFLLRLDGLGLHRFDGVQVVVDVFVLGALDRPVRSVRDAAEILNKSRIDAKHTVLVALGLNYIADDQCSDVTAVFEISGVDRLQAHFVKDLAALSPLGKNLVEVAGVAPVMYSSLLYSLVPRISPFWITSCTT